MTMMFCTTFLSTPSEELTDGGAPLPGGCLAPLHCLVLPQDELYGQLSDPVARLSLRHHSQHGSHSCFIPSSPTSSSVLDVGHLLLDVGESLASSPRSPRSPSSTASSPEATSPSLSGAWQTGSEHRGKGVGGWGLLAHKVLPAAIVIS